MTPRFFCLVLLSITHCLDRSFLTTGARDENFPIIKSDEEFSPRPRSDGTVGYMRPARTKKEVKKLVGYIRDGMNHANSLERQKNNIKEKARIFLRKWNTGHFFLHGLGAVFENARDERRHYTKDTKVPFCRQFF